MRACAYLPLIDVRSELENLKELEKQVFINISMTATGRIHREYAQLVAFRFSQYKGW